MVGLDVGRRGVTTATEYPYPLPAEVYTDPLFPLAAIGDLAKAALAYIDAVNEDPRFEYLARGRWWADSLTVLQHTYPTESNDQLRRRSRLVAPWQLKLPRTHR